MQATLPSGIRLEYETFGAVGAPAILLVMGLGAHMLRWNTELCEALAAAGYRVIRFDNRDAGRSSQIDDAPVPNIAAILAALQNGERPELPYGLDDMADDCLGLLDALAIAAAHVVGASMGGAIAQLLAARHPDRVRSLTCIMASSGNPRLPGPTPPAAAALFAPLPQDRGRASIVADGVRRFLAVCSPAYATAPERLQAMLGEEFDRGFHPRGVARQLAALVANGDRRALLHGIDRPTLVLHGADDPLIPAACGEDIARHVPGARLCVIDGWGHDLPVALTGRLVAEITAIARAGDAERHDG